MDAHNDYGTIRIKPYLGPKTYSEKEVYEMDCVQLDRVWRSLPVEEVYGYRYPYPRPRPGTILPCMCFFGTLMAVIGVTGIMFGFFRMVENKPSWISLFTGTILVLPGLLFMGISLCGSRSLLVQEKRTDILISGHRTVRKGLMCPDCDCCFDPAFWVNTSPKTTSKA